MTATSEIQTETESDIESGIEDTWERYAYVDDGEHAMVVGVEWADVDMTGDQWRDADEPTPVRYAVYVCDSGLVDKLKGTATRDLGRVNNLSDAAVQIMESLAEEDGRDPLEAARDYWA
jgi:hypothetical protein